MQTTTNYGLKKPDGTDNYDKANDNSNMDTIDTQMKANADAAAAAQTTANAAIPSSSKGSVNGVASLDGTGQVPASQLDNVPPVNAATTAALGTVEIAASPTSGNPIAMVRVADADDVQITGTSAQTVATYTPAEKGNFLIVVSVRVVTGTTNVAVEVDYNDASGAQVNNLYPSAAVPVGTHMLNFPLYINAVAGTPITIKITASVANQVYASASIVGV